MIVSSDRIPMVFTDGECRSKDIWQFAVGRCISRHALHDLLMFHYFPWGETLIDGVRMTYPFHSQELCRLYSAATHWDALDLDRIDDMFTQNLVRIPDNGEQLVYVGMSGGPDSSLIAAKLVSLPVAIKGFTIILGGIDESEDAERVADELGVGLEYLRVDDNEVLEVLPNIVEKLGLPYDRGSLIPSYFIFKHYRGRTLVLGDGAEPIFEPSYRSRLRVALGRQDYARKLEHLTVSDLQKLTGEWIAMESPFIFRNQLVLVALFDMISETPFYYLHKLSQFTEDQRVCLPYLDTNLYATALSMKELQVLYPHRKYLYTLIGRYMDPAKVKQVKMPLKIRVIPAAIERYLDAARLRRIGIDSRRATDEWTKYILALLSIWLECFERYGGILELR